jgi:hypothetical protein
MICLLERKQVAFLISRLFRQSAACLVVCVLACRKENIGIYFIKKKFVIELIISDIIKHSLFSSTGYSFDVTLSNIFMDADSNWQILKFL